MKYLWVVECKKIELSARTTYQYSSVGKIKRAFLNGKAWNIQKMPYFLKKKIKQKQVRTFYPIVSIRISNYLKMLYK